MFIESTTGVSILTQLAFVKCIINSQFHFCLCFSFRCVLSWRCVLSCSSLGVLARNSLIEIKLRTFWWIQHQHSHFTFLPRALHLVTTEAAMTSKSAKETIVAKLGFKSSSSGSKAEAELEKVKKENVHLRKKIDDLAKRHIKPPDADKSKLLEVKRKSWLSQ